MDPEVHQQYHAKIELEKQAQKEKEKADNSAKSDRRDNLKIPQRDNLRFKELAIYRAMCEGDMLQCDFIQNKLLTKPEIKGYALCSKSIEEFEELKAQKDLESHNVSLEGSSSVQGFDESSDEFFVRQHQKQVAKEIRKHAPKKIAGRKPEENSDKDLNIHSSRDYWEDIEPKMNVAAKNLDFSKNE